MKQTPRRVTIRCFKLRCDFTDERLLKGAFVFCSYNTSQWDPKHALLSFYCLKAEEFVPLHSAVFPWRLRGEGRLRLVWTNKGDLMLVLLTLSLWKSEVQLKKKRRGDDLGASLDFAVTCTNTKTVIYRPLCRRSMSSYILLYMMFCFVSSTKYECPWMAWKQHKLWLVASYDYWAE